MKIKIVSQKYNPLLKRKEVVFEVDHSQQGQTPPRLEIRRNLAGLLTTKLDVIFVERVETKTGTTIAIGDANAYETLEQAKLVEPKHILARNALPEKPEENEKTKADTVEEKKPEEEIEPKEETPDVPEIKDDAKEEKKEQ